jgi:hypothetical protein
VKKRRSCLEASHLELRRKVSAGERKYTILSSGRRTSLGWAFGDDRTERLDRKRARERERERVEASYASLDEISGQKHN